ncbi:MAG: tetratricopeptide repeat protein [Bacteroidales bacterium]|nr:tetratricopeptide repeat protein [Bacteroidales bacterium]
MNRFLVFLFIFLWRPAVGQEQAIALYNQAFYSLAKSQFQQWELSLSKEQSIKKGEVAGYITLCNIALNNHGLEDEVEVYIKEYPYSTLIPEIWFRLANHFFAREEYESALGYYEKCPDTYFGSEQRSELFYKMGYAAFQTNAHAIATQSFSRVLAGNSYDAPSIYYRAYIDYLSKDFSKAIDGFTKVAGDARFAQAAPYYILQSRFLLKQYEQVVLEGEELYVRSEGMEKHTIARILAESCFILDRLPEAQRYLDAYLKNAPVLSRQDHYLAGMIHYAQERFFQAIPFFEEAGMVLDSLGQNALYYLGETYIQTKNKLLALNTFQVVSSLDFDPVITEDALFNYAKLSFDLNNNTSSFYTYMERYPDTKKSNEIQSYIADAYLLNKDYRNALTALQAVRYPERPVLEKLQRASFLRGMQLFNAGSYREAEPLFNQAINSKGGLVGVTLLATYWKAESLYRSNRFEESIQAWTQFRSSPPASIATAERRTAVYNIAYAYFQLGDYAQAESHFKNYLTGGNLHTLSYYTDAQNRLGDCAFLSRAYPKAIEYYGLAVESNGLPSDYSLYQTALAQGLLFQQNNKILTLRQLISVYPSGAFAVPATFELGRTYVQTGAYSTAESIFNTLIQNKDAVQYYSKAIIELGLIQINLKNPDRAMAHYKKVLEEYPDTPEADNALAGIENIYLQQNNARGYFDYIAKLGISSRKSADEKEQMLFSAGEQLFLTGSYNEALKSLRALLQEYPNGAKSAQAHFYIAEILRLSGKEEEATDEYLVVMRTGSGSFAEQAALHYARLCYLLEKYDEAVKGFETLSEIAILENNKTEAEIGKSRSYYKEQRFEQAIRQVDRTLRITGLSPSVTQELNYIKGKSHLALGQREQAMELFQRLASEIYTPIGAESAYLLIQDAYNAGNFAKAEERIYALSDSDSPQHYWIALSFIILADIYADQNEVVQALATYQSLLDEYRPEKADNVHDIVRLRIEKLNQKNR